VTHPPFVEASEDARFSPTRVGAALRKGDVRYRLQQSAIHIFVLFLLTQIASVVFALVDSNRFNYLSRANIVTELQALPLLAIVGLGVGLLMIAGEFDLSVGANYIFSSTITAQLVQNDGFSPYLAALVGLVIGMGIGLLNGVITIRLRIPSFITTLGTLGIWSAATLFFHGSASQEFTPSGSFSRLAAGDIGWMTSEFIWMVALGIAFWALLQRHRIGNHIFAAGGNRNAAVASGVNVTRAKLLAFVIAGACAALAGILSVTRLQNVSPGSATDLPLQAIAAAVIGGVILTGGSGTILGILVGAALIYWIQDLLLLLAAPGYYLSAFVGTLIIVAAATYEVVRRRTA
jgi:simple sugar transport system permease protein